MQGMLSAIKVTKSCSWQTYQHTCIWCLSIEASSSTESLSCLLQVMEFLVFQTMPGCRMAILAWACTGQLCELISDITLWFSCCLERFVDSTWAWVWVSCVFLHFLSWRSWCLFWSSIMCVSSTFLCLWLEICNWFSTVCNLSFHPCTWIQKLKKKVLQF